MDAPDGSAPIDGAPAAARSSTWGPEPERDDGRAHPPAAASEAPAAEVELITIELDVGLVGDRVRVDRYLASLFTRLSRARIHKMIAQGRVRDVGSGAVLDKASRLREGQRLVVQRPRPQEPNVVLDYRELFRDDDLLAIDKPAGLPVHPSARYHLHTLTALMRERLGSQHGWEMAHRLDRETSGVMLFGRRGRSEVTLKQAFFRREVAKEYLALVHGHLERSTVIDIPLGAASDSKIRIKVGPRAEALGGLPARTEVTPLAHGSFRDHPITLIRACPQTGRTHQIRVHLDAIGHAILGDKMYGIAEDRFLAVMEGGRPIGELEEELGLSRHALHAYRLTFRHPTRRESETMVLTSPWPRELADLLTCDQVEMEPAS